jgi:hypothetical protein
VWGGGGVEALGDGDEFVRAMAERAKEGTAYSMFFFLSSYWRRVRESYGRARERGYRILYVFFFCPHTANMCPHKHWAAVTSS